MGLAYCKSLCTSTKTEPLATNGTTARSHLQYGPTAASAENRLSTIQYAVETQENVQPMLTVATAFVVENVPEEQESYIERDACNESDLGDNEMKEIEMGDDKKILLIKQNGKFSAIGAKCTHYGADLVQGALGDGRVRCIWHGACFNIETGDIEDFPGVDSLPCFQVKVEEGIVKVRAKKSDLDNERRTKKMPINGIRNGEIFVIIGGGPAAQTCAETLRQNGFTGRIVMICKESVLPYHRVTCSKFFDVKIEEIQLRTQEFYDENQIEVNLGVEATSVDTTTLKEVTLSSGNKLKYDKLFIATGSRARKPEIPGSDLRNIFTLRNIDDGHQIDYKLKPLSHVIILGSSFIALEAAAYCVDKVAKVTIIGRGSMPLHDSFGEAVGNRIKQWFESKNVEFIMKSGIKCFLAINQEEELSAIKLQNDDIVKADICIVGIGSELNTDFLHNSGLSINENGSIDTNLYLESSVPGVYIGGDIANSPVYSNNNELATIGHYALAQYHGKIAGLNMIGSKTELKAVPYFFTYLFDKCFTYSGHGKACEILVEGDLDSLKFVAFYLDENENVIAVSACQPDKRVAEFAEKLAQGQRFAKKDLSTLLEVKAAKPSREASLSLPPTDDFIEKVACNESDLEDNEMKEIDMGNDKKVLLIKQQGKFSALGSKCAHYGVSLIDGALGDGRIRCPYHGACFNIETGDIEEFPGLDSIPCFQVKVEQGVVKIRAKKSDLDSDKRVKSMPINGIRNGEIFVLVGGGPSSQTCAETLRQNGFTGRILMVCKESFLPYDRVKISKYLNIKFEEVQLRSQAFYDENKIEVRLGVEATSLETTLKEISLSSGSKLKYDKLFIATGSRARKSKIPGSELRNIFTLRNIDDANEISSNISSSSHVVILGTSFIGLEVATFCVTKAAKVTIIGRSSVPLHDSFGEVIGNRIMQLFRSRNVEFIMNSGIKSFQGSHRNLESIELLNGKMMWADICIVGIGAELNTDFLHNSGLSINKNGSIDTSLYLESNVADVYVGGDIANSPVFTNNYELATISHYAIAQYHGKIAGLNMMGSKTELKAVPYFFTYLFDKCFTFTGYGSAHEIFIEGDLDSLKFVAFYFDEKDNVIGMASCQPDRSIAEFAEKLAQGYQFHKTDIEWVNENE